MELRTRLSMEENETGNAATATNFATDNGLLNLSKNLAKGNSYVLNSTIDRVWVAYEKGNFMQHLAGSELTGDNQLFGIRTIFSMHTLFSILIMLNVLGVML